MHDCTNGPKKKPNCTPHDKMVHACPVLAVDKMVLARGHRLTTKAKVFGCSAFAQLALELGNAPLSCAAVFAAGHEVVSRSDRQPQQDRDENRDGSNDGDITAPSGEAGGECRWTKSHSGHVRAVEKGPGPCIEKVRLM